MTQPIAWLYPLITDGLALVAYAATTRLSGRGRRYAWAVVVLAAGMSGLAQATYLAGAVPAGSTPTALSDGAAPVALPPLRFGVGAWPAVAAAIVAHLLFLLGGHTADRDAVQHAVQPGTAGGDLTEQPTAWSGAAEHTPYTVPAVEHGAVQPGCTPVQPVASGVGTGSAVEHVAVQPAVLAGEAAGAVPARERARAAARDHAARTGDLPSVSELVALADVARGTAAAALRELREERPALQVISTDTGTRAER